jgi:uroporphyrin-III C-methyltransferase/precorrin-2 dehydrogenase/sirohydrochlorin ferrochelatase/uroporphyrin-III C-methyltransferase
VILIENGTTVRQRQHITTLAELPTDPVAASFRPPTLIVIGRVVELADELAEWSEYTDHADLRGIAYG